EFPYADCALGFRGRRHRDHDIVGLPQHLVYHLGAAEQREIILHRPRRMAADRADRHVESTRAPGDLAADPSVAEEPERLARQFRPYRRNRTADRPLALPLPA